MHVVMFLPLFVLLNLVTGEETKTTTRRYPELHRLHDAMKVESFPKQVEGKISLWIQDSPTQGRLKVVDADEWPLRYTVNFFGARLSKNDLRRIVIISENGLSIRFVDPEKQNVVASRGDVVAILLADPDA